MPPSAPLPSYPDSRQDSIRETLHGVDVPDPYRWLEDQNSPETRAWIEAQNAYTETLLNELPGRDEIRNRLEQLMKVDVLGTPVQRKGRYFFSKRLKDQDLFVLYVRKGVEGTDEVLVDPHPMSSDHTISVGMAGVTKDGSLLAFSVRQGGEDEVEIRFLNVETREELSERIPKGRFYSGISFLPDASGLYYTKHQAQGPRVYFHRMGTDASEDREIFGEGYGAEKLIGAGVSDDGQYLLLTVFYGSAAPQTEIYLKNLETDGPILPIVNDIEARFYGDIGGDQLFLQTNWNAPNGKIIAVPLDNPVKDSWCDLLPESDSILQGFSLVGGKVSVSILENVIPRTRIYTTDGELVREIAFPVIGSVSGLSGEWESDETFFSFSSFHIPWTTYRYSLAEDKREVWARLDVPVESDRFEVEQAWYKSKDGTRVPMFLVHAKGLKKDSSHPTLMTAYGGFLAALTPGFSATAILWAERGGVFAMPNLRGGGEFGEEWHQAGMLANKQNVFDDFISAAEWLIKEGYTQPSKLAISGGSNGGLLVGAAMTQRPDLFRAVICSYPLLDMVRYHQFLVARFWVPEYGSSEDAEQFKILHAYSPYHRVKPGERYPAVLFVTGDSDTRVDPLHARKMAALVQSATGSGLPALLRYDTKLGHSGGRPVGQQIEDMTNEQSFLFWQLSGDGG